MTDLNLTRIATGNNNFNQFSQYKNNYAPLLQLGVSSATILQLERMAATRGASLNDLVVKTLEWMAYGKS